MNLTDKVKQGIDNAILERLGGKGYSRKATGGGGDWEDSDRGEGNKATRRAGGKVKVKSPTYIAHVKNKKLKEDAPTMSAGSDPAGFSNDADNNGPVAGVDQPLGGTQKQPSGKGAKKALKYKCKKSKDGVNEIDCRVKSNVKEGRQPDDAASSGCLPSFTLLLTRQSIPFTPSLLVLHLYLSAFFAPLPLGCFCVPPKGWSSPATGPLLSASLLKPAGSEPVLIVGASSIKDVISRFLK